MQPLLDAILRLFPNATVDVSLHVDPELRDEQWVVVDISVPKADVPDYLAAHDERIKAAVGVVGFTRYTELIGKGNVRLHGVYYFAPGVLEHFDTEAIYALIAPRPLLMLSGDRDGGLPLEGIEILEKKFGKVYRLHDKSDAFRSVVYRQTGHEYLPEMKDELIRWLDRHLAGKR